MTSCAADLTGVWRDAAGERWMLLDHGASIEGYPIFADATLASGVLSAPRVIDLERQGDGLFGQVTRRYERRADACDAHAPVQVTACRANTLELTLADPPSPLAYVPCAFGAAPLARSERWRRD